MSSTANAIADAFLGVLNIIPSIIEGSAPVIAFLSLAYLIMIIIARVIGGLIV